MTKTISPSIYYSDQFIEYEPFITSKNQPVGHYTKNSFLTQYGKANDTAFFVKSGVMHLSLGHEKGGEKSLVLFGPGSLFPIGVSSHDHKMDYDIVLRAFTDVSVIKIPYTTLREMALENSGFAVSLLEQNRNIIGYLLHDSVSQAFELCKTRICDVLYLCLTNMQPKNNTISISQNSLANFVGSSKPQMERSLKELRDAKVIETSRNRIRVLSIERLLDYCSNNVSEF